MKFINKCENFNYYELTNDEIFLYHYMETLAYENGIQVETDLVGNILSIKGNIILVRCVIRYFEELGKSSKYKTWLRKYKLNDICSKLEI